MTLKDHLEEDLDVFFNTDEFAEMVGYTPADGGAPVEIPAFVDFDENPEEMGTGVRSSGRITVKAADVPAPRYRDAFVRGGVTFTIVRVLKGDGRAFRLAFERDVRPTFRR